MISVGLLLRMTEKRVKKIFFMLIVIKSNANDNVYFHLGAMLFLLDLIHAFLVGKGKMHKIRCVGYLPQDSHISALILTTKYCTFTYFHN